MEPLRTYTEHELGEVKELEHEIKAIFYKDFIPSFLVRRANNLIARWKMLTGWKERTENPIQEPIIDEPARH